MFFIRQGELFTSPHWYEEDDEYAHTREEWQIMKEQGLRPVAVFEDNLLLLSFGPIQIRGRNRVFCFMRLNNRVARIILSFGRKVLYLRRKRILSRRAIAEALHPKDKSALGTLGKDLLRAIAWMV